MKSLDGQQLLPTQIRWLRMATSLTPALQLVVLAGALGLTLAGCEKSPDVQAKAAAEAAQRPLLISQADLRLLQSQPLSSGPVITGTIQPERRADLRAEVSAVVQTVLKENGDAVKRGELLVRLDDTSIRDSMASAAESVRSASQSLDQTERQLQRLKTLQAQGMTSTQAMEDAQTRRNTPRATWWRRRHARPLHASSCNAQRYARRLTAW